MWHPKVHFHVHKGQSSDRILSHLNSIHIVKPKIYFNIILPSTPVPQWTKLIWIKRVKLD
jgi:hypothetical protein